jgi:hypothetical protein
VFEPFVVADSLGDQDVFPRVAVAGSGDFVVVFERDTRDIRARGYAVDTSDRFTEQAVNAAPVGSQLTPDVAADPAGRFVVVWSDDRNENALGQIRVRAFTADGAQAQAEGTANPRGGGDQWRPRIGIDQSGRRYVVWEDDEDRNGVFQIHAHGVDASGVTFLDSFTVNTGWRGQQRRPVVATR